MLKETLGSDFMLQIDHQNDLVLGGFSPHLLYFSEDNGRREEKLKGARGSGIQQGNL